MLRGSKPLKKISEDFKKFYIIIAFLVLLPEQTMEGLHEFRDGITGLDQEGGEGWDSVQLYRQGKDG